MTTSLPLSPIAAQIKLEPNLSNAGGVTVLPPSTSALPHSSVMARAFLRALDPNAERFTFQLFRDPKHRKNEPHPDGVRLINHCTADEAWALAQTWNTLEHGYGLYVTVNETDLHGRKRENIVRVRAVFVDVDNDV